MDEEIEKPFPIELIVILMIVAIANDAAEIFFDILSATGVGLSGEGIMEPADLILDVFFSGIFIWKMGLGGTPTIIQYIDDLLEAVFVPGRTISVGVGIWVANHPTSTVALIASNAVELAEGNVVGAATATENTATAKEQAESGEKMLPPGTQESEGTKATDEEGPGSAPENQEDGRNATTPGGATFENPYDNPVGTAQREVFNPSEDNIREAEGPGSKKEPQKNDQGLPKAA